MEIDPELAKIGRHIQRTRRYLGMTGPDLARLFHIDTNAIWKIEKGLYQPKTAPTRFKFEKMRIWAYTAKPPLSQRAKRTSGGAKIRRLKDPKGGQYTGERLIEAVKSGQYQRSRNRKKEEITGVRANLTRSAQLSRNSGNPPSGDRESPEGRLNANQRYYLQRVSGQLRNQAQAPATSASIDAGVGRSWDADLPGEWADD